MYSSFQFLETHKYAFGYGNSLNFHIYWVLACGNSKFVSNYTRIYGALRHYAVTLLYSI